MNEEFYTTRDTVIAATLLCLKFPLQGYDVEYIGVRPKPIYWFQFENTERLKEAVSNTINKQVSVEPMAFSQNVRMLKSIMVNEKEKPRENGVV